MTHLGNKKNKDFFIDLQGVIKLDVFKFIIREQVTWPTIKSQCFKKRYLPSKKPSQKNCRPKQCNCKLTIFRWQCGKMEIPWWQGGNSLVVICWWQLPVFCSRLENSNFKLLWPFICTYFTTENFTKQKKWDLMYFQTTW